MPKDETVNNNVPLLSKREAAKSLSVCERTIDRMTKAGTLTAVRLGPRATRFRAAEIAALAERGLAAQSR
jgi:excisionase family DNA binding protein